MSRTIIETVATVPYADIMFAQDAAGDYQKSATGCHIDRALENGVEIIELWPHDSNGDELTSACFSAPMANVPALILALQKALAGPLGRLALDAANALEEV